MPSPRPLVGVLLLALAASPAAVAKKPPPQEMERVELARTHFAAAEQLFAQGRLREAVVEYEMAQISFASQSVDLQIARCYDRLGQPEPAIEAYQRYLAINSDAREATEAKERILALRDHPPAANAPPPPPPIIVERRRPSLAVPIAVAGLGLATLTAGAALEGAARADFDRLKITCAPRCAPGDIDPLRTRDQAGIALLAVGGVILAVDVVLWITMTRSKHRRYAALPITLAPVAR